MRVRDRRAEAQLDKGMSQTKVKSRMYASKFPTERSPMAKCVMIAEANTDAPKSFCDAPDGTGHRDMARSGSSARELGRPADAKAAAGVGGSRSSGEAGNDRGYPPSRRRVAKRCPSRGAKGSCLHGVSNRDGGMRLAGKAHHAKRRKTMYPESDYGWCDAPRSSLGETRGESRCGHAGACL